MGLLFGVIYIKTESLASTIVLHFILNLTAYTMPYVMPNFQTMNPVTFILSIFGFVCLWVIETYFLFLQLFAGVLFPVRRNQKTHNNL